MHQAYFERKLSQPSTGSNSRSLTPKPFSRMQEDPTKSPERTTTEFSQISTHSPTVSHQKVLTNNNTSFSSSVKAVMKSRDHVLNTDRNRPRNQNPYVYNPKSQNNVSIDIAKMKTSRNHGVITKTEPNAEQENLYVTQINKLHQKMNKLRSDLTQSQERENQYLNKLSNLEKENKSLQLVIEEKEKRIQEISQRSKEDKVRMYQFLTELESHKQTNSDYQGRDDLSTARLSDLCDSSRRLEKGTSLEKGNQTTDGNTLTNCQRCESVTSYCELLINKLEEAEQASKYILKEHNTMKESLMKAKRAENDYIRARSEIEKKTTEIQSDFDKQSQIYQEVITENITVRKTLLDTLDGNSRQSDGNNDVRKSLQMKSKKEQIQPKIWPLPASLKALAGAERLVRASN